MVVIHELSFIKNEENFSIFTDSDAKGMVSKSFEMLKSTGLSGVEMIDRQHEVHSKDSISQAFHKVRTFIEK